MSLKDITLAILIAAFWGSDFVVVKLGLDNLPPLFFASLRYFFAAIPFVFFLKRPQVSLKVYFLIGFVLIVHTSMVFLGLRRGISPGLASILLETQVFFTMLLAFLIFRIKTNFVSVIGALIAFLGVIFIAEDIGKSETLISALSMILVGALFWGISNLQISKLPPGGAFSLVVWASLIPPIPLLALSYFFEGGVEMVSTSSFLSAKSLGSIFYVSVICGVGCYGGWCYLLKKYPPNHVAPFSFLMPLFGVIMARIVFGEVLRNEAILGCGLIVVGLSMVQLVKSLNRNRSMEPLCE